MANKYIPPQFAGNLVYLDEAVAGIADVLIAPPAGRWVAIHNIHGTALNILAPENEVLRYIAEDGDARSDVHGPINTGKLDANQSILGSISNVVLDLTASESTGGASGTVTVTRAGSTFSGTVPSFDGIVTDGDGTITAAAVNAEGAGLEEGDVITFSYVNEATSDTGIVITITVAEDDLQLGAGFYALKTTTRKQIHLLAAGDIMYFNNSKIEIQAADGGDDGIAIGYFG
tara:strand:+ start:14436 stop:15128 length:693 start_codon:yes stop_codon:yes gene_type:complete